MAWWIASDFDHEDAFREIPDGLCLLVENEPSRVPKFWSKKVVYFRFIHPKLIKVVFSSVE